MDRRDFMVAGLGATAGGMAFISACEFDGPTAKRADTLQVGLVGCGGRGTGAAMNILEASPDTRIVALGDIFPDRIEKARESLTKAAADRATVAGANCFVGFDAYKGVFGTACDIVILATPPGFRPVHFKAAVEAGKNVFMEKPVAVDPVGIRSVLASAEAARAKRLTVVAGTQRRHEQCYLEAMDRIHRGDLGDPIAARVFWNMGGLWNVPPQADRSDMENQLRNWLYYTWLSGDHVVEQHVHNCDVANWAFGAHPIRAVAVGGRQARVDAQYGHIFDHFGIDFEYPGNRFALSMARQMEGTPGRVEERIHGTEGVAFLTSGSARIEGANPWRFEGKQRNPYVQEHIDLIASIRDGAALNEGKQVAESTMTAILGRMAAYTGADLSWDEALASDLNLMPEVLEFGPLPTPRVSIPGKSV